MIIGIDPGDSMTESQLDIITGTDSPARLPVDPDRTMRYLVTPVPKPRMTQRDKWQQRPAVLRYRAFCDQVRALGIELRPTGDRVIFLLPMPVSWSAKKRDSMLGKPHQGKPDCDNLIKALGDALHQDDAHLHHLEGLKFWGEMGEIIIERGREALEWDGDSVVWR
jgi:Holliday junction resolvase RusA-like endonuclease